MQAASSKPVARNYQPPLHSLLAAAKNYVATPRSPLEILDLRHFSSGDLRPLLDEEIAVWAKLLSWDYSGSAEMILRYVDARILPATPPSNADAFADMPFLSMKATKA